jgi:hypothetical protein
VDSAVAWTTWITLMGCAGLTVLALAGVTGPTWPWPKLPAKRASVSTWAWGAGETVAVAPVMLAGYRASGRLARHRVLAVTPAGQPRGLTEG